MGLIEALGSGPVAIDSCILIYFIERHPAYAPLLRPLFRAAAAEKRQLFTSALTLLEVGVLPLRKLDWPLYARYERVLLQSREVRLLPIRYDDLRLAALIRARYHMKTPDALHLAAAMRAGCTRFLTNDRRLRAGIPGIRVVSLDDNR